MDDSTKTPLSLPSGFSKDLNPEYRTKVSQTEETSARVGGLVAFGYVEGKPRCSVFIYILHSTDKDDRDEYERLLFGAMVYPHVLYDTWE